MQFYNPNYNISAWVWNSPPSVDHSWTTVDLWHVTYSLCIDSFIFQRLFPNSVFPVYEGGYCTACFTSIASILSLLNNLSSLNKVNVKKIQFMSPQLHPKNIHIISFNVTLISRARPWKGHLLYAVNIFFMLFPTDSAWRPGTTGLYGWNILK